MTDREQEIYRFADLVLDLGAHELRRNQVIIELEPLEFDALVLLISKAGQLVRKQEFMDTLWQPGVFIEDSRLPQIISILRKKIGDNSEHPKFIETIRKRGYKFIAPVNLWKPEETADETARTVPKVPSHADTLMETSIEATNANQDNLQISRGESLAYADNVQSENKFRQVIMIAAVASIFALATNITYKLIYRPRITSISPPTPLSAIGDQGVVVYGNNFQEGLMVKVLFPNGESAKLRGSQIQKVTPNSFVMMIDFNGNPLQYGLQVHPPCGFSSSVFVFEAIAFTPTPVIEAIYPAELVATKKEQEIVIYGSNFQNNPDIQISFPDNRVVNLGKDKIIQHTHTNLRVLVYLDGRPGDYKLTVRNTGNNKLSIPFPFTAR